MKLIVFVLLFLVLDRYQSDGQCVTGTYSRLVSQGNFWAIGYTGRLYSSIFSINPGSVFTFDWRITTEGGTVIDGPSHIVSSCTSSPGNIANNNDYTSTCTMSGSTITAELATNIPRNENLTFDIVAGIQPCGINIQYNAVYCGNLVGDGLVQAVPANTGYQSNFTFSCLTGYSVQNSVSQCQANAMWSPLPSCIAVCNTSSIPENSSYIIPNIPEQLVVNSTIKLNCTDGHNGSALATCVNVSTWNVENNCSAVCDLNATYCDPSGARSVLEGVHSLTCCNDRSKKIEANCNSSGIISYSNSCISVSTTQSINVATNESTSTQTTEITATGSSTVSSETSTVSSVTSTVGSMPEKDTTVPATTTSTASTAATTVASPTTTSGTQGGLKWWEILLIVIFAGICPLFAILVILWFIYDKEENRTGEGLLTFYFKCRFYERIPWCSPCSCCKSN